MRSMLFFASRNRKEMLRDPMSLLFGIGFPIVLLLLLHIIQRNIPAEAGMNLFALETLTPGICVFGLSFLALFAAMLVSKDRTTSFMLRLFAVFAAYIKRFGDSVSERRGKAEICHAVSIVDLLPFPVSRQSIRLQSRAAPFDNIGYIYIKS